MNYLGTLNIANVEIIFRNDILQLGFNSFIKFLTTVHNSCVDSSERVVSEHLARLFVFNPYHNFSDDVQLARHDIRLYGHCSRMWSRTRLRTWGNRTTWWWSSSERGHQNLPSSSVVHSNCVHYHMKYSRRLWVWRWMVHITTKSKTFHFPAKQNPQIRTKTFHRVC